MGSVSCSERIVPFYCPSVRAHFKEQKLFGVFFPVVLLLLLLPPPLSLPTLCCVIAHYSPVGLMVTLMWIIASGKSPLHLPRGPVFFSTPPSHKQIILNHWKMGVKHTAALLQIMHCYKGCNCPLSAGLT